MYSTAIFFFLIAIFTGVLQSDWGKDKVQQIAKRILKERGIHIHYASVEGILPFHWKVKNLEIEWEDGEKIFVQNSEFRPYLLRLIRKEISFRKIKADGITLEGFDFSKKQEVEKATFEVSIPYILSLNKVSITNLELEPGLIVDMNGKLRVGKDGQYLFLDVSATRKSFKESFARLRVRAEKKRLVQVRGDLRLESNKVLEPFYSSPINGDVYLRGDLAGRWDDFEELIFSPTHRHSSIRGKIRGKFYELNEDLPDALTKIVDHPGFLSSHFHLYPDRSVDITHIFARNPVFILRGKGSFEKDFDFKELEFRVHSKPVTFTQPEVPFDVSGQFRGRGKLFSNEEGIQIEFPFEVRSFLAYNYQLDNSKGYLQANLKNDSGFLSLESEVMATPWNLSTKFQKLKGGWLLSDFQIQSSIANATAEMFINSQYRMIGDLDLHILELETLSNFYKPLQFFGNLDLGAQFDTRGETNQLLDLNFTFSNLFHKGIYSDKIDGDFELENLFETPTGHLYLELQNARYENLKFDLLGIETKTEEENWPFEVHAEGLWRDPMEFFSHGFWRYKNGELLINVQDIDGHVFTHPFTLYEPSQILWHNNYFSLSETQFDFYFSSLKTQVLLSEEKSNVQLTLDYFPLDFLSLNPLDLSVKGFVSMEMNLNEEKNETTGDLHMTVESMQVMSIGDEDPLWADGTVTAHLEDETLDFDTKFRVREKEIMDCSAKLPMELHLMPMSVQWDKHREIAADVHYDAPVQELLDFMNTGPHRLEGDLKCQLHISDNLSRPCVKGECNLSGGAYENYYTGTYLEEIYADLTADCNHIILNSLRATDGKTGDLTAKGRWELHGHYPYSVEVDVYELRCVHLDFATALVSGQVELKGDRSAAVANGNIEVIRADLSMPEKLPKSVPKLPVTYIHAKSLEAPQAVQIEEKPRYPIHLRLSIDAPDNIFVRGRGLSSEWRGNFHIGGTYTDIIPKGKLELLKGEFVFSGRVFDLNQGSLVFTGKSKEMPQISIKARTVTQGVQIIAGLKGPLTKPRLSFRSIPSLPLGSILSYLIFGNDISELNGFQALQLAAAVTSLSGEGPDVLESARKTLGVDRLTIVSSPVGEDEDDQTAVQIGKYITKGVMVGVKQGTDQENYSSNVIIEIDLTHGWIFQAESQQEREQGKFTVKWNHNY